jgi:hypothetical protein
VAVVQPTATGIEQALAEAGGVAAPRERAGQLRALLVRELGHGARELARTRSGYGHPVVVAMAATAVALIAVAPVSPALRADAEAVDERSWLLVAALVGALVEAAPGDGVLLAGAFEGWLALTLQAPGADPELVALAFEEHVAPVDRLRAVALALPAPALADVRDLRPPIGAAHPLNVARAVAGLGGRPADPASLAEYEDAVLAETIRPADGAAGVARPHADPVPSRRVARRILQRLDGMGKWGGYHTEFHHLARGFAGNDRALAEAVGEALLDSGLLAEKPSVGQRHVFLNPRRAGDIRRLVDDGELPATLHLPDMG